ncbi:MAG: sigma-70 family RNA polymerase sigma factor [Oscillospiraceae bacterium]|nr:sigma-70 family RNA polymerase sigma factor [Oscillospiraceae bacterium]
MTEFEGVYRRYFKDVFLYILRLSKDKHIAEEITSETFLKAMRSINKFKGDCDIRVWLCQIAKNSYFTYLKKVGCTADIDEIATASYDLGLTVEEKIEQQDEATKIKKLLHNIPNPYKEVFMWRVFAQLSFKQIGQIFNKSDNWACVTYHRAKNMIRQGLEEYSNEE